QHLRERALARAVRTHDCVHLASVHREVEAAQDRLAVDANGEVAHRQQRLRVVAHRVAGDHQPTLPSRLTTRSFCASTANSIGNSLNTSLQKPLTIIDTASSAERPRWRQ